MSVKAYRRMRIKAIYPLACQGVVSALRELRELSKGRLPRGLCEVCGVVVVGRRCQMHDRHRLATPRSLITSVSQ